MEGDIRYQIWYVSGKSNSLILGVHFNVHLVITRSGRLMRFEWTRISQSWKPGTLVLNSQGNPMFDNWKQLWKLKIPFGIIMHVSVEVD